MLACCIAHQMDKRKRIELDIYEASATLAEIGAGITLSQGTFKMLAKVGLGEDILKCCDPDYCSFPLSDV